MARLKKHVSLKLTTAQNDAFWDVVEDIGWCDAARRKGRRKGSVSAAQQEANALSRDAREAMREIAWDKVGAMQRRYYEWCERHDIDPGVIRLGDDNFSDLVYHVVGCGRSVYAENMRNPGLLFRRAKSGDFEESFGYLFL